MMKNGFWQTIGAILKQHNGQGTKETQVISDKRLESKASLKAQREWYSAIASLQQLLLQVTDTSQPSFPQGLILSSPTPVLSHQELLSCYQIGIFTTDTTQSLMPFQLPAATETAKKDILPTVAEYSLLPNDPLSSEPFCLVLTQYFSLVMALGQNENEDLTFQFSFDPQAIQQAWKPLKSRLRLSHPHHLDSLTQFVEKFAPTPPDYRLVMEFSRLLLQNLPNEGETFHHNSISANPSAATETGVKEDSRFKASAPEVELLQAFTHEIRTPLTTIRMLTRSLLKRRDLTPDVKKRLEVIDQECTEQIDRMELIFRATELKSQASASKSRTLTSVSLEEVFQQSIPCWKKHAQRRNVELDVILPDKLPTVISDRAMLHQVLTGLMEKFTRSLPTGGQIRVQVSTAGNQLKLQVLSSSPEEAKSHCPFSFSLNSSKVKSLGQLLMFQPETGGISLNLDVTKNLFQALGGKLIVRQRPEEGEVLTIFLPLDSPSENKWDDMDFQAIPQLK